MLLGLRFHAFEILRCLALKKVYVVVQEGLCSTLGLHSTIEKV